MRRLAGAVLFVVVCASPFVLVPRMSTAAILVMIAAPFNAFAVLGIPLLIQSIRMMREED